LNILIDASHKVVYRAGKMKQPTCTVDLITKSHTKGEISFGHGPYDSTILDVVS